MPVGNEWPAEDFNTYLEKLMRGAGIKNRAELGRRSGVDETQFSAWRSGRSQPSWASLQKLAPHLGVSPVQLAHAAGLPGTEDLDDGPPRHMPTTRESIAANYAHNPLLRDLLLNVVDEIVRTWAGTTTPDDQEDQQQATG